MKNENQPSGIAVAAVCALSCAFLAAGLPAAEYRVERTGDELHAFADGKRFAVLAPAECVAWSLRTDTSEEDFIRFRFEPKAGLPGTFRFPEIRLDGDAQKLKAVG